MPSDMHPCDNVCIRNINRVNVLAGLASLSILAIIGLSVIYGIYSHGDEHTILGPGQVSVRHVQFGLNTKFCETYEVNPQLPSDVILVTGKARLNPQNQVISTRNTDQLYPHSVNTRNSFYLLEKSTMFVNACMVMEIVEETVALFFFKGDDNYDSWIKGETSDSSIDKLLIDKNSICGQHSVDLQYKITTRDTYYVALSGKAKVQADLTVMQTTFDTTHARQICLPSTKCIFKLDYGSNVDIVVKSKYDQKSTSFETECHCRVWFGAILFLGCSIFTIGTLFCLCYYLRKQKRCFWGMKKAHDGEAQNLIQNE